MHRRYFFPMPVSLFGKKSMSASEENIFEQPTRYRMTYFRHPKLTLTLVAGDSFSPLIPRHDHEVFIVRDSWYPSDPERQIAEQRKYQVPRHVHFLSNTEEIHRLRLHHGFQSHYVNIGCFIDDSVFTPSVEPVAKEFDAVMIARFTMSVTGVALKRHYLTSRIHRLALLDPVFATNDQALKERYCHRENCLFHNMTRLPHHLVAEILRRSHCGLILSELEGVCRASCEYLLTGIPVVSTPSVGGRDVWYDDYNAIIVEPREEAVADAVERLKASPRAPQRIREGFQKRAAFYKDRFRDEVLQPILNEFGVENSAQDVMQRHPFLWWPGEPRITPDPDGGEVRPAMNSENPTP
jgi:glycosyltransferase involved in cell wall biosynthesis